MHPHQRPHDVRAYDGGTLGQPTNFNYGLDFMFKVHSRRQNIYPMVCILTKGTLATDRADDDLFSNPTMIIDAPSRMRGNEHIKNQDRPDSAYVPERIYLGTPSQIY